MRVFLPPPWSQTQVWIRRASWARRAGLAGLAKASSGGRLPPPAPFRFLAATCQCSGRQLAGPLPRCSSSLSSPQWCFSLAVENRYPFIFLFFITQNKMLDGLSHIA